MSDFHAEVAWVASLPRQQRTAELVVAHGYAVHIGIGLWFWFEALPPALAFGRAARMSLQCSSFGVYRAASQARRRLDTLYVMEENLDRKAGERQQLQRWVDGIVDSSAYWHEPAPGHTPRTAVPR